MKKGGEEVDSDKGEGEAEREEIKPNNWKQTQNLGG